ncbi:MAG: ribosomal RNA small subunit methyltransferase A [Deltaproteobacteria bacterium GWA2_38_16]|nr:MAG: ribosomal RNA small subunit methyltransferase A [Deltaproteobacteria bacterium GWA2_38_16]OGQ03574.1 MAG: ribosomal RNA small subunit methyltransferase A [Deltaproteobacteria bacterium RIFCSPHIGHO2_02_FULL_38_15]OGQ30154.1 MAG: ribosomal RNA small subunit methyltransferase A [Deltaproteobacteria bacterium RIFCSPLOWO2_01_FULL_38_9]OGQ64029.1 MAG: ribosomal RNA small subunit methyltransferase A [Deltaproteobacteria bacterium RIFCSPLOWO2_12_FULL_38_8]HBQ21183.1 ribosomal RNA small subunit 
MDVKKVLTHYHLRASQYLSQNFLHSEALADRIVEASHIEKEDIVLEVGAGLGILTKALAKKAKTVMTFEKDKKLWGPLPEILKEYKNIEFIFSDFLAYPLGDLSNKKVKVVANLPFSISTEIMFHFFKYRKCIETMTLMFQKEVAKRIVAVPNTKDYGVLSILSQLYSTPKILFSVPPSSFYPVPEVAAAVIHFKMNEVLLIPQQQEHFFIRVVKTAFMKRRKMLSNSLHKLIPQEILQTVSAKTGISLKRRMETLSLEELKKFVGLLYSCLGEAGANRLII